MHILRGVIFDFEHKGTLGKVENALNGAGGGVKAKEPVLRLIWVSNTTWENNWTHAPTRKKAAL